MLTTIVRTSICGHDPISHCLRITGSRDEFDFADIQSVEETGGKKRLLFEVGDRSGYSLRVTASELMALRRVELIVDEIVLRGMR